MMVILYYLIFLGYLSLFHYLLRKYKYLSGVIVFLLPLCLTPYWMHLTHSVFAWAKVYSVIAGNIWIYFLRFTKLSQYKFSLIVAAFILVLNILEAILLDIQAHHWINATTGILIVGWLAIIGLSTIKIGDDSYRDFCWSLPLPWVIAFTVWDLIFVANNYNEYLLIHTAVLGIPLFICCFIKRELWLQARAFTLFAFLLVSITNEQPLEPLLNVIPYHQQTTQIVSFITLIWTITFTFNEVLKFYRKRFLK
jgi:hypothetical protein